MQHGCGRTYVDGNAQRQIFRLHFQRPQARLLFGPAHRGNHAGCPAGTFLIHLAMPIPQLLKQIFFIVKPAYLKKGRLDETDQILHAAFLLGAIGPTQLDPHPHLQRGVGKNRIPFRHLPVFPPLESDRLGPIKDALQGKPAPTGQMLGQGSHQALDRLIRHKLTRIRREYFRREAKKWMR